MRKHILLIDDDRDELPLLCDGLTEAGFDHKCTWARSVTQAMEILKYLRPDCILIDYQMPQISGLEGIRMIRERSGLEQVPVILYTSSLDPWLEDRALAAGADACIEKPSSHTGFACRLQDVLARQAVLS